MEDKIKEPMEHLLRKLPLVKIMRTTLIEMLQVIFYVLSLDCKVINIA